MNIKDPLTGSSARVQIGRLETNAVAIDPSLHQSIENGSAFQVGYIIDEPNNTEANVIGIKNTGDQLMVIELMVAYVVFPTTSLPSTGEYFKLYKNSQDISGGVNPIPNNLNFTSNNEGNQTIYGGGFTVGTIGSTVMTFWAKPNVNDYQIPLNMVLGQNDFFHVTFTSGTSNTDGKVVTVLRFFFLDEEFTS